MKLIFVILAIPLICAAECTPHDETPETIPLKRIVNGKVERCAPSGKWVKEGREILYTQADLVAAANSGYRQGAAMCVEEVKRQVSAMVGK